MRKINTLFRIMMLCTSFLMIQACVKDLQPPPKQKEVQGHTLADLFGSRRLYLALQLNDLTQALSRAIPDITPERGEASESAFLRGYILLYMGSSEENAMLQMVYSLSQDAGITSGIPVYVNAEHKYVFPLDGEQIPQDAHLYALAIVNANAQFTLTQGASFKIGETECMGQPFSTLQRAFSQQTQSIEQLTTNGLMMSNTPLEKANGLVHTLSEVEFTHLYPSSDEALQGSPAATIYLQRLVAKVTLKANEANRAKVLGWTVDNTNQYTYLTQVPETNQYSPATRSRYFYEMGADGYHVLFGQDPNYDYGALNAPIAATETEQFQRISDASTITEPLNASMYLIENTFNLNGMRDNYTSRIIVKYQYKETTFYTLRRHEGTVEEYETEDALVTALKAKAAQLIQIRKPEFDDATLTLTINNETGKVATLALTDDTSIDTYVDEPGFTDRLIATLNELVTVYPDGICYYPVYIRHFSDTDGASWTVPDADTAYYEDQQLGRYGVMRNHWYELTVNSAPSKPGYTGLPPYSDNYDDDAGIQLQPTVRLLPWYIKQYTYNLEI